MGEDKREGRIDARAEGDAVFLATDAGVASVPVDGATVDGFGVAHECDARDVASGDGRLAVATSGGVLAYAGEAFVPVGFGPAVAVGFDGDDVLAADDDGRVARMTAPDDWTDLGATDGAVRAIDGDLLATDAGVYAAGEDALRHVGLGDVRDVATPGTPHAATADGLYRLGNGWMDVLDGDFHVVSIDPGTSSPGVPGVAHVATRDALYEHRDGEWTPVDRPVAEPVVDVAYGESVYVVTRDATLLASTGDATGGWHRQSLDVDEVRAAAVF